MTMTEANLRVVEEFRNWIDRAIEVDGRFAAPVRDDRPDHSTLATRYPTLINPRVMIEVAVRPYLPQLRVGIVTDDRWKSEDFEEKIQESGDSMSEFVGLALEERGVDWPEPPVEHYREQMKYFYFATPVELDSLDELARNEIRDKARRMVDGYYYAFEKFLA